MVRIALLVLIGGTFLLRARPAEAGERLTLLAGGESLSLDVRRLARGAYVPMAPLVEALDATVEEVGGGRLSVCVEKDICAFVSMDDSDGRIIEQDGERLVALSAVPELFRSHFTWNEGRDALELAPGVPAGETRLNVGDPVGDIVLPDLDGRAVSLSAFRGKKVVLYTWASW